MTGHEAVDLKRRLARVERDAAGRRQFDDELRAEVVGYVRRRIADGASQTQATKELGLKQRTVWGWLQARPRPVVREVELLGPSPVEPKSPRTFEVRFSNGASISGLLLDDVAALLRSVK